MVSGIKQRPTFTFQQVKDYMTCPLCYHIEHVEKQDMDPDYYQAHRRIASDEAMLKAVSFYYFRLLENKPPTLKELYNKYYRELGKLLDLPSGTDYMTDVVTDNQTRSVTRNGYKWMRQFYEWNAQTPQAVIAVNHSFFLCYDEVVIEGRFPLIREVQNEEGGRDIELLLFGQSSKSSPLASTVDPAEATFLLKGFQDTFGVKPDAFKLYSMEKGRAHDIYRTDGDLKRLESSFLGFYESVQRITPYQKLGAHPYHGKYKKQCDTYFDGPGAIDPLVE